MKAVWNEPENVRALDKSEIDRLRDGRSARISTAAIVSAGWWPLLYRHIRS